MNFFNFSITDSTNTFLINNYKFLPDLTFAVAEIQSNGRGRLKRKWISPLGGLWFSVILKDISRNPYDFQRLTSACILKVLERKGFFKLGIKWPNDIFLDGSYEKIGGILQENIYLKKLEASVIGVGINVNNETEGISENKINSLKSISGRSIDIRSLFYEIIIEIERNYIKPNWDQLFDFLLKKSILKKGMNIEAIENISERILKGTLTESPVEKLSLLDETGKNHVFISGDVKILL